MSGQALEALTDRLQTSDLPLTKDIFKAARHQAIKSIKEAVFPLFKASPAYDDATKALR
jgi:hypothetical protein